MIPEVVVSGESQIPPQATFWLPDTSELNEEGIGYFRGVWTIVDVSPSEAQEVIEQEQALVALVDHLSANAEDFDRLAHCIEHWDPDEEAIEAPSRETAILNAAPSDFEFSPLRGLELGVAGLVYALAANGIVPAASCRGHLGSHAWSESPVVLFAADESHARGLEMPVQGAGCFFDIDPARPELLAVGGKSITNLMRLALLLFQRLSH
ncbi:MAG: hypothetical protein PGN37_01270 [Mycobacterium kyogaense]|uniref:hypothetical protein n=1 Tax=Mycobacterium kyogaense TaxID=2212479 RepID=UPI002FFCD0CC